MSAIHLPKAGVGSINFDISLAANSSSKPYFRAFSTGGINQGGNTVWIDPDAQEKANGGFNPGSNPPGAPTYGRDNVFFIGAADFVTRISRVHSVWFEAIDPFITDEQENFIAPFYIEPTKEPRDEDQPAGTAVNLAFRGASNIRKDRYICDDLTTVNREPLENALFLYSFGDYYDDGVVNTAFGEIPLKNEPYENSACDDAGEEKKKFIVFINDEEEWRDEIIQIAGAPFYQVRITFESDIFTGLVPELSALAIAWYD